MPTLTIDGREITVEPGTRILQAAERLGIDIPRFCYHPGLSIAANCRMCLVETNRSPKLVPSCYDACQDGMVVTTNSAKVLDARRSVLEFILLNHPVDCPICDQAGECDLQDLYFAHDHKPSRHEFRKAHKAKARPIGPRVMYDAERCINCTRCVRVCDEVARAPQLRQVQRGERTFIDVFPGMELDHPYSMLTADVCPVGALTNRDFRFRCRVWLMSGTQSVCGECSRGCSVRVDTYRGEVQRVVPRHNPNVNRWWACDAGRLAYHRFEAGRITTARVRGQATTYPAAVKALAEGLAAAQGAAGVVLSPWLTCEDAWAIVTAARTWLPQAAFAIGGRGRGAEDDVLVRADRDPDREGLHRVLAAAGVEAVPLARVIESAASLRALLVFGEEHAGGAGLAGALPSVPLSAVFAPLESNLAQAAGLVFPTPSPYETDGTWVNEFRVAQRVRPAVPPPGDARAPWRILADVADCLGAPMATAGAGALFGSPAAAVPELLGLTLDSLGEHGVVLGQ